MSIYTKIKDRQAGEILDCWSCEHRASTINYREIGCGVGKNPARCRSYKSDRLEKKPARARKKTLEPGINIWKL